jgi:hypothetical protein
MNKEKINSLIKMSCDIGESICKIGLSLIDKVKPISDSICALGKTICYTLTDALVKGDDANTSSEIHTNLRGDITSNLLDNTTELLGNNTDADNNV